MGHQYHASSSTSPQNLWASSAHPLSHIFDYARAYNPVPLSVLRVNRSIVANPSDLTSSPLTTLQSASLNSPTLAPNLQPLLSSPDHFSSTLRVPSGASQTLRAPPSSSGHTSLRHKPILSHHKHNTLPAVTSTKPGPTIREAILLESD